MKNAVLIKSPLPKRPFHWNKEMKRMSGLFSFFALCIAQSGRYSFSSANENTLTHIASTNLTPFASSFNYHSKQIYHYHSCFICQYSFNFFIATYCVIATFILLIDYSLPEIHFARTIKKWEVHQVFNSVHVEAP